MEYRSIGYRLNPQRILLSIERKSKMKIMEVRSHEREVEYTPNQRNCSQRGVMLHMTVVIRGL